MQGLRQTGSYSVVGDMRLWQPVVMDLISHQMAHDKMIDLDTIFCVCNCRVLQLKNSGDVSVWSL